MDLFLKRIWNFVVVRWGGVRTDFIVSPSPLDWGFVTKGLGLGLDNKIPKDDNEI